MDLITPPKCGAGAGCQAPHNDVVRCLDYEPVPDLTPVGDFGCRIFWPDLAAEFEADSFVLAFLPDVYLGVLWA